MRPAHAIPVWIISSAIILGTLLFWVVPFRIVPKVSESEALAEQLEKPRSAAALDANLEKLSLPAEMDRVLGSDPGRWKLFRLEQAVYNVLIEHPEKVEAWQLAAAMISRREPINGQTPPRICGADRDGEPNKGKPLSVYIGVLPKYQDCTIVLDDAPQIVNSSSLFSASSLKQYARGSRRPLLQLRRAVVIYKGGEILPVDSIGCEQCSFVFDLHSKPPLRGRFLVRSLLEAADISNVGIELSGTKEPAPRGDSERRTLR